MSIPHARHLGINNRPVCMICGAQTMNVTRRSPHPLYGNAYELQTFECRTCGKEIKRSSDGGGPPHGSEAAGIETVEPKPQPCTKCGAPVVLARTELAEPGFDLRTVECSKCNNADQYIVEHGAAAPWSLRVRAAR
jgi:hypothetical protein